MALWVYPDNTLIAPGYPCRSVDANALRDNFAAVAEGAAGAPKLRTAALQPPAAGTDHVICRVFGPYNGFSDLTGTNVFYGPPALQTNETSYLHPGYYRCSPDVNRHVAVMCLVPGEVFCSVQQRLEGLPDYRSYVRVLKNQTVLAEWDVNYGGTDLYQGVNATVATGDVLVFQQRSSDPAAYSQMFNINIYSANPDMAVV